MHKPSIPTKLIIAKNISEFILEFDLYLDQFKINNLLIISGSTYHNNLLSYFLGLKNKFIEIDFINSNEIENISKKYDWVLGLGGGKVLDRAKYCAYTQNAEFISVPTLIAHDGICSPVAVIDNKSLGAIMPHALFVPLFIIKSSPINHIKAGVGDLVANLSAIEDWKLAEKHTGELVNDFAIMISKKSASDLIQKLQINFLEQKIAPEEFLLSEDFLFSLTESLALSGIAMSISGNSRPCSGGEHLISHAIDKVFGHGQKAPHGIQVLIATLYLEKYREKSSISTITNNLYNLREILKYYDFPLDFSDIQISADELKEIIEIAPQMRAGRYSILNEIYLPK
jgi:glycerol-1-phosphate dehydrogenase [NAD(P)+]